MLLGIPFHEMQLDFKVLRCFEDVLPHIAPNLECQWGPTLKEVGGLIPQFANRVNMQFLTTPYETTVQ